ncbi:MAG: hypothetical protein COB34_02420 [Methylophilaceae bacterium]|nr:MAG: hypothetical protein COB34_02420 [Methylophilaceae bacterium]
MLYKKRNRVARLPFWQSLSTHITFVICAISGVLYLLAHEFDIQLLPIKSYSILIAHGFASYFFALLFGAVMPVHIKAGWKNKRNKISGSLTVLVMGLLLLSGLVLYYGADTRDAALWVHWVIGCGLVLLFPFHFIAGRRANYLAMKHAKKSSHKQNT